MSPTVNPQARELKKIAKPAISSGVPTRPRGFPLPTASQSVFSVSPPPPTPVDNIQVGKGPRRNAVDDDVAFDQMMRQHAGHVMYRGF